MVHTDVGRKPTKERGKVVMGAPIQGRVMRISFVIALPCRVLELVLHIKQPDAGRCSRHAIGRCTKRSSFEFDKPRHAASNNAIAKVVAMVLAQGCQPLRISPIGRRCCTKKR